MNERTPLPPSKMSEEEFLSWLRSYFSTEQDPLVTLHRNIKKRKTNSLTHLQMEDEDDGLS
ncbi:hypothetical protein LSG31_18950 [Fodinisporobacter ferrooxydans]|uniref:Uncharacterized protein n=1 Tax=Fodinisporobacter ferrooxydans TaxID=2901836 RepID=A0ABY4CHD0_9BACL|nr:hypothetical protein LSG31_18950 [Alicyclobacillaceae bacterium MYW30-H2]